MPRKAIVAIGWGLVAVVVASFFAAMLVAVLSGHGLASIDIIPGGRGGQQFPIAVIPLLLALLVPLWFWMRALVRRRISKRNKANRA